MKTDCFLVLLLLPFLRSPVQAPGAVSDEDGAILVWGDQPYVIYRVCYSQ